MTIPEYVECLGVPYKVTLVNEYAFGDCSKLTSVKLPDGCALEPGVFSGCSSLVSFDVPDGVEKIARYVFSGCTNLTTVTIPEGVVELEYSCFANCSSLTNVVLPQTLTTISPSSFQGCASLGKLHIPASVTEYEGAFAGTGITELSFGEGIEEIPNGAFKLCRQMTKVTLPSTLQTIGDQAFFLTGIESLELPASIATIGQQAFSGSSALSVVIFDGNASTISYDASFANVGSVSKIVYRGKPLRKVTDIFPSFSEEGACYSDIHFYASDEDVQAQRPLGTACIKHGTPLRMVRAGALNAESVYDGSVPELPQGCTHWVFDGHPPLTEGVSHTTYAVASSKSPTDLAGGSVVTEPSYAWTGRTIDPFVDGTGSVVSPTGELLIRSVDFTLTYERLDANGVWKKTNNKTSRGTIRLVATAVEGSAYTGTAYGYYAITDEALMPGQSFSVKNDDGIPITYLILHGGNAQVPGTVAVGVGGNATNYSCAVDQTTVGEVNIPATVTDRRGNVFKVEEISPYAFYRCMGVTGTTIPQYVDYIGPYAFAYENIKTDTQTSGLARISFNNDMEDTTVGKNAFLGCDIVSTVVYGQKRGIYERIHPFQNAVGVTTTRYLTARFYSSEEDLLVQNEPVATVVLKEGSYLSSPSYTDYYFGSDQVPLAGEGKAWHYETAALDDDDRIIDSQDVYAYEVPDDTVYADIDHVLDGITTQIPCRFTKLAEPTEEKAGMVSVGVMQDGRPAIDKNTAGFIRIPETITLHGETYDVVEVGAFAFGSTGSEQACTELSGVELPTAITTISQAAFMNCTSLATVTFSSSVTAGNVEDGLNASHLTRIGASAFYGCTSLRSFDLPKNLKTINDAAFENTALVRMVLPPDLSVLGKRTFQGCSNLREVVFAGASHLELPVLEGVDEEVGPTYTTTTSSMMLPMIEDYTFTDCPHLSRVVFEQNAASCAVSPDAFSGSSELSVVVFGGTKADFSHIPQKPAEYYTISYYNSTADQMMQKRAGYLVLPAGCIYDQVIEGSNSGSGEENPDTSGVEDSQGFEGGQDSGEGQTGGDSQEGQGNQEGCKIYAGAIPPLLPHFEWVYSFDTSVALENSASACMQKIRYSIDTTSNDVSFTVEARVNGEQVEKAAFDDTVDVSVATSEAVKPTSIEVIDEQTGAVLLTIEGATGSFTMPAGNVRLVVDYSMDLVVEAQKITVSDPEIKTLSVTEVSSACTAAEDNPLYCSSWTMYREAQLVKTTRYIGLLDLLALADVRFDEGDSLIIEAQNGGNTQMTSLTYEELYDYDRNCYPQIGEGSMEGAYPIKPIIALNSAVGNPSLSDVTALPTSLEEGYRLCFGQMEKDFSNVRDTASKQPAYITKLTVLYGPESVDACTLQGLEEKFYYTGDHINPPVTVFDGEGVQMTEGVDYELTYGDNVEAGQGSITIKGIGVYKGTTEFNFPILRAQTLAGAERTTTSAAIAMNAYPTGSDGAIIASATSFPDALSATALSGSLEYPVLLTGSDGLSPSVKDALAALSGGNSSFKVIVVGGSNAIGPNVYTDLAAFVRNDNFIIQLAGTDRYATSQAIYDYGKACGFWGDTAIVANGTGFADVLSISSYAAVKGAPILLTDGSVLQDTMRTCLSQDGFTRVILTGGLSAVSAGVQSELQNIVGSDGVVRLGGANRYETCLLIANFALTEGMSANGCAIASGANFPDALAGGAMLAREHAVLLLVGPDDSSTLSILSAHANEIDHIKFLGGQSSVSMSQRLQALAELSWSEEALS